MAVDLDSLVGSSVSAEELKSGEVQIGDDGKVVSSSEEYDGPIDSGAVEAKFREMLERQAAESFQEAEGEQEESEEQEAESEEEVEEAPVEKPAKKDRSANARIRELNAQKKEYQQKYEQAQAQYQQTLVQMQQQVNYQQQQFQQKLMELEQRRLEMAQQEKTDRELAGMTEVERRAYEFRRQLETEAAKKAEAAVAVKLDELNNKIARFEDWQSKAQQHAEQSKREQQMNSLVNNALDSIVLKDIKSERTQQMRPVMEEMLTLYAAAYGVSPEQIAPQFLKFMDTWAQVKTESIAKSAKNTMQKGKALPKPAVKSGTVQKTAPTMADIRKMGFENFVQYRAAQAKGKVR